MKFKTNQSHSPKVHHTTSNAIGFSCPHCNEGHKLYHCEKFAAEDGTNRYSIVKSLGLCFNCLGSNHSSKNCRVFTKCRICKGKHHTLLHSKATTYTVAVATEMSGSSAVSPESSSETNETTNIANHFVTGEVHKQTLLATALIKAESKNGNPQIFRALLDQGSQASFISEAAVQLLQLNKIAVKSVISGLGGGQSGLTSKAMVMVIVQSLHDPTFKLKLKAYVLSTVTSVLPENSFVVPHWAELHRISLADPRFNKPNKIDVLLGAEVYCQILKKGLLRNPKDFMIAQDTYLGWVVSGQASDNNRNELQNCHNVIVNLHVTTEENESLKKFWELESEPILLESKVLTPEEQACEDHFQKNTKRDDTGRYVVNLPFRQDVAPNYGDTRRVAVQRLLTLERKLEKSPEFKNDYAQALQEYLDMGHMEEVSTSEYRQDSERVWLPHHAVVRIDKTTTKTRVLFNASSRCAADNITLNEALMVGPKLQPDLRHTIMRWRKHCVCLTADIIKMYRQIRVTKKDADYQRIVWREDTKDDIHDYRLLTVTFGTSCAPYLAVKALQQVAEDEGENYPVAASRVKTDFYMDDLMTGSDTVEEAVQLHKEMNELLEKGGFKLQKWACNKKGLLEEVEDNTGMKRELGEEDVTKVVGLTWNRRTDNFDYNVKLSINTSVRQTKRLIIGEICRLYDPLGWISPCIITAKIFIQKLWLTGLDWDAELPEELQREWELYRKELSNLVNFHIPRWIQTTTNDVQLELHGFSDASTAAYSAVVYVRCVSKNGEANTHLVTAKTKVAPIKQVSIPRLELCGAVLAAKLLVEVAETLNIRKSNLHAWTDSTIVLAWLSDHPCRWKTFVANRTSKILNLLDSSQWSYVQSKQNPADSASRGLLPSELIENKLWKYRPEWLKQTVLPYGKPQSIYSKSDLEAKTIKAHATSVSTCLKEDITSRFSSLRRLLRVVAYCRRFLRLKEPTKINQPGITYLTALEIQISLTCCIRLHQARFFNEEIIYILKQKEISNKSKLSTLNPYLDPNGILRVGGRIEKSDLPGESKHPIIICGDSPLAKLIVADAHEKTLHGGQQLTCNYIRAKYWIIKLKNIVRQHIHVCVPCIRYAAKSRTQLMGQLPSCRVTANKPFLNSGVDYAGPINIRVSKGRGQKSYKGYICLFICMATRAVHIEAVSDLTSEGFLSAFKRFVARRVRCAQLWSDNGTNFIGASRELKTLFYSEQSSFNIDVATSLANNGTEWHFIPPHAPNFGGLWEAGIKSTKHHLKRVIGDSTLTYEELVTVLSQVEACLNSRPLSQISCYPDEPMPLTPGHFLTGEPLILAPDHNFEQVQMTSLRRWQLTQRMIQHFWRRWSREYLTNFFQRYKWKNKIPDFKKGDVVLVKEDNLPPAKWLYGRVIATHPGRDNLTRVVSLKCKNSEIQRPTSKLCPLPVNE